jgi:hypothetical protein
MTSRTCWRWRCIARPPLIGRNSNTSFPCNLPTKLFDGSCSWPNQPRPVKRVPPAFWVFWSQDGSVPSGNWKTSSSPQCFNVEGLAGGFLKSCCRGPEKPQATPYFWKFESRTRLPDRSTNRLDFSRPAAGKATTKTLRKTAFCTVEACIRLIFGFCTKSFSESFSS